MKQFKLILPLLITAMAISCDNMGSGKKDNGETSEKHFSSPAAAAAAAKNDMLQAMNEVNFGVDQKKLAMATPGTPVRKYEISWESLLKADSASSLEQIARSQAVTLVPLMSEDEVIAIVSLTDNNKEYSIGGMGDAQVTQELELVRKATSGDRQGEISGIYEVPNLNALIYAVTQNGRPLYYTAYNNNSLRQGMSLDALMPQLKADALQFEKQYGAELRKNKLVK